MKADRTVWKISIMRGPYSAYSDEAFGLVFKLSYAFKGLATPLSLALWLPKVLLTSANW